MNKISTYFKDKKVIKALIAILTYYVISEVFSFLISLIIENLFSKEFIQNHNAIISIVFQFIIYLPILIIIFVLFKKNLVDDFTKTKEKSISFSQRILKGLLLMYLVNIVSSILVSSLGSTDTSENQRLIETMITYNSFTPFIMFLLVGLIGPLVEEVIFRKCFKTILKNDYLFIIVSTIFFGFMHVLSTPGNFGSRVILAIPYMASGFSLSYIYIKNDSNIIVPTICHMLTNSLAFILILSTSIF